MPSIRNPNYPHRHNRDGTHDSICPVCLTTIVSSRTERTLDSHEAIHVCDPIRLLQLGPSTLRLRLLPKQTTATILAPSSADFIPVSEPDEK
jgi:hypothetical protein